MLSQISSAHHSVFAEYDINGSITIEGEVTEVWFKNPHVRFFVKVTSEDGKEVIWNTHGHNPSMLRRAGWMRETLKVGEKIICPAIQHTTAHQSYLFVK